MALTKKEVVKKLYVDSDGSEDVVEKNIEYSDAYIRIEKITGNKDGFIVLVVGYDNKEKKNRLYSREYSFSPEWDNKKENIIDKSYEHIKKMPEYTCAKDC